MLSIAESSAPVFSPLSIIGMTFLREREADGSIYRAKIIEQLPADDIDDDNELQFHVELGDGTRSDILTYNRSCNT